MWQMRACAFLRLEAFAMSDSFPHLAAARAAWAALAVTPELGLTSSRDVLQALGQEGEPGEIIVALGYSGWGAGQLEHELAQNAWLTVPADPRVLFELPFEERLPSAMETLGVDFANLSETAGHA